jgi:hypothetical protein
MAADSPARINRQETPPIMKGRRGYTRAREHLRQDFDKRCAYCCIHEKENGQENFEIDHFQPVKHGGAINDYRNLYWSCAGCNGHKASLWPTVEMQQKGIRFADPCNELDFPTHFQEDENGILMPITPCGAYHVKVLRLNRDSRVIKRRHRTHLMALLLDILNLIETLPSDILNSPYEKALQDVVERVSRQIEFAIPIIR